MSELSPASNIQFSLEEFNLSETTTPEVAGTAMGSVPNGRTDGDYNKMIKLGDFHTDPASLNFSETTVPAVEGLAFGTREDGANSSSHHRWTPRNEFLDAGAEKLTLDTKTHLGYTGIQGA